jgi:hypothetical protein
MAIDTAEITTGLGDQLKAAGIGAVGAYLRSDRFPQAMLADLHANGIKVWSIWEKGEPISDAYFSAAQGAQDASEAMEYALSMGQPAETTISPCCDYDSNPAAVAAYLEAFHGTIKSCGYYSLPYGNGATLQWAIDSGYAVGGYLSQSTGFQDYASFYHRAAIIQGPGTNILGLGADLDIICMPEVVAGGKTISLLW